MQQGAENSGAHSVHVLNGSYVDVEFGGPSSRNSPKVSHPVTEANTTSTPRHTSSPRHNKVDVKTSTPSVIISHSREGDTTDADDINMLPLTEQARILLARVEPGNRGDVQSSLPRALVETMMDSGVIQ